MVNFNLEGLDELREITQGTFGDVWTTLGVLAIFLIIGFAVAVILLWVFGSVGLMNLAKKNKVPNPWLAFIPIGRSYLIGKLGFEVYDSENKNKTTFMWITFGLGAAAFVLGDSDGDIGTLVKYALLFFESWAFYNMFKKLNSKNSILWTVFTVLSGTLLGGVFLYAMKSDDKENLNSNETVKETFIEEKKEEKKETPKEVINKGNFCSNCGAKLTKTAKFCSSCGKEV